MGWTAHYGPDSPLTGEERDSVDRIIAALQTSKHAKAPSVLATIEDYFERLDSFGALLARFPSPLRHRHLGHLEQSLSSLAAKLCTSCPTSFEFFTPTRAIVGRALDMAELNFYRLLRHACGELLDEEVAFPLQQLAEQRIRVVLYTKLVEEVLSDLIVDGAIALPIRRKAAFSLALLWDRRLTYRAHDFFPLLEATWEARSRVQVIGGTLLGTQEMFALFREGCDPRFVDYFVRSEPPDDEVAAFREFLFGTLSEELQSLSEELEAKKQGSVLLPSTPPPLNDPATPLYEFYRKRSLQALARRVAKLQGPKQTAEGYVMVEFLERISVAHLLGVEREPASAAS